MFQIFMRPQIFTQIDQITHWFSNYDIYMMMFNIHDFLKIKRQHGEGRAFSIYVIFFNFSILG